MLGRRDVPDEGRGGIPENRLVTYDYWCRLEPPRLVPLMEREGVLRGAPVKKLIKQGVDAHVPPATCCIVVTLETSMRIAAC